MVNYITSLANSYTNSKSNESSQRGKKCLLSRYNFIFLRFSLVSQFFHFIKHKTFPAHFLIRVEVSIWSEKVNKEINESGEVSPRNFYFLSSWSLKAAKSFSRLCYWKNWQWNSEPQSWSIHSIIKIVILEALKRHRRKVFRVYDNFNLINFVF